METTVGYYEHWETVSAYRVRRDVLQKWLRSLFNDEQIAVHESDDSQYGFWLTRPLSEDEKKVIRRDLSRIANL